MFEVGKQYKAPSGYVCVVLYVGEKVALVRVTEARDGNGTVGAEFVVSRDLRGYEEYTPPKVYGSVMTVYIDEHDMLRLSPGDIDILRGKLLGKIVVSYTEGGRLLTRVEQE